MKAVKATIKSTLFTVCFIGLLGVDCSTEKRREISEVDAIYWHEGKRYSAAIVEGKTIRLHRIPTSFGNVIVVADVEKGKSWYACFWEWNNLRGNINGKCEIHIRNIDELKTAGWNHGKFGTGATTRID